MKKYKFKAKIEAGDGGGAYVFFPYDTEKEFATKGRVPIKATFDGVPYTGSLLKYGHPQHMLGLLKSIREQIGKGPGDTIEVTIQKDEEARVVEIPPAFEKLLKKEGLLPAFEKLSYTHRKEYCRWLTEAKREETRLARLEKAIHAQEGNQDSRLTDAVRMHISQIVEAQSLSIRKCKTHGRARLEPAGPQALKLLRLDRVGHLGRLGRMHRYRRIRVAIVIHIHAGKDARRIKAELRAPGLRVRQRQREGPELPGRRADLPLTLPPVNHAGRILRPPAVFSPEDADRQT